MDWKTRISALCFWIFIVLSSIGDGNAEKRVVCYYTNWSVYRPGTAKFSPQNINPYLCTHLIYAFGGFTKENTLKPFDKYQDIEKGGYAKFTGLKTYNKDLKTMLAIGGWNEGSSRFSPMVADPGRRKEFVKNTVKFLRQNHFDGLDLDWEYPAFRDGGKPRDRNNYADLVQELREEFERESSKTGRPRLLLSMAVPAGIEYIDKGYDVPRLNEYLDFINLLSYDYHSAYEPAANHHSPLYPLEEDNEYNYDTELTIDYTITHLLKSGASSEKIVLGIPTYGRSYTLFNEEATDIGAPADGPGEEGDATREKGYLAYYEICESIAKSDEWQVVQPNPSAMGPYAFRGNQWVGYDDEDIVRAKARYVNEKKLGGIMFWSIDNDDFRGKCHGRPYPLIEAAKEAMLTEDEKSNSGTKTRVLDARKKSRPQAAQRPQVNSISRKFKTGRRSTTTETPSTRRRISTSRSNGRSNGRSRGSQDIEDNEEDNEEEANSVKSVEKPRPRTRSKNTRLRNQSLGGGRKKQQNSRNNEAKKTEEPEEEPRSNKLTTPEPPTTPDPGSDFKCEDEGFFPHPRDCKKYFWCLDSGPSGLGIVGHQFTCPSGLVFNKAADSCDYPRNVVCPKTKTAQNTVTTPRAPITAATSRTTYLHKPTPRTTTPKEESEEEYEYYDDEEEDAVDSQEIEEEIRSTTTPKTYKTISRNRPTTTTSPPSTTTTESSVSSSTKSYKTTIDKVSSYEDEEDPRVIKELIDLIKKAGGIEQLEKQLLYQDKISGGNAETTEENGKSTPATISRSLYERVLNRQATRIAGGFLGSFSTTQSSKNVKPEQSTSKNSRTGFINGPGGAQFEGLDQVPEVKTLRRTTKHQYVTIDRQRQTTSESPAEDEDETEEEEEDDNKDVASSEDRAVSSTSQEKASNRRFTPSYVNIRRSRPSTTTSENDVDLKDDGEEAPEEETGELEEEEVEEPVTEGRKVVKTEEETPTPKSRYTNVQRFRSTTLRHSVDEVTERVSLENDVKTSTTTSTTTEKIIPVTEEISEISTTLPPTTAEPKSSSSTSINYEKVENATHETSFEDTLPTSDPETTKISSSDVTLKLVENSATEILFTTVPAASSISTGSNYDSFTRGPTIAAVSQPRPFGFSRRGRPTTTANPPTAVTSVTEQTRTKVDSETLRLPTLKELVGFTTTLSNHVSTSEFTQSSTTNPIIDTTIAIDELRDESDERESNKNQINIYDLFEGGKNLSDPNSSSFESTIEKEILDNDILSSEEILRRSSSTSLINFEQGQNNGSSHDQEKNLKSDKELKRVEVPVRILDDTNGEEIAEFVLLRVPERTLNSAVLKPVFRVKILEQENNRERNGGLDKTNLITKPENLPESSSENELSDNFRSTPGRRRKINLSRLGTDAEASRGENESKNHPRSRQRIVKARRRTRPLKSLGQDDEINNVQNDGSGHFQDQVVRRITRRREDPEKSAPDTTTLVPEVLETISNTIRPTTLRGNHSLLSRVANVTRGFYITKDIDEAPTTSDPITTEFSSYLFEDSTQEIDITRQEIEFTTLTIDSTTPEIESTTQIDETARPLEQTDYTTENENDTNQRATSIDSIQSSIEDQQLTTSLETVTSNYMSTIDDEITEFTSSSNPTTEGSTINGPEITTFRPRTTERAATPNPTVPFESRTTESLENSSLDIENNLTVTRPADTTEDGSESLKTSENSYLRSSTIIGPNNNNLLSKTLSTKYDEQPEARTESSKVENTTESTRMTSDLNNMSVTMKIGKFEVDTTTILVPSTFDQFNGKVKIEAERSSQKILNVNARATTHHGASNRGGVRFTQTKKSPTSNDISTSRSRNQTQKSTSENLVSPTNSITTKSYDVTARNTVKHNIIQSDTESLPPSSTQPSRRRGNARKTTRTTAITETKSSTSNSRESISTDVTVTNDYENSIRTSTYDQPTYLTTNYIQHTVDRSQNPRASPRGRHNGFKTTKAFNNNETRSYSPTQSIADSVSTTESYDKAVKITTRGESSYASTNVKEDTTDSLETSKPFSKVSSEPQTTSETFGPHTNVIDTSDPNGLHVTMTGITDAYDKTSVTEVVPLTSEQYEISTERSSARAEPSSTKLLEDQPTTMKPTTINDLSSMITSPEFNEQTLEQTTLTVPTIYLTTNFVELTENDDLSSQTFDSGLETTRFFMSNDSNTDSTSITETSTISSATTNIYEETSKDESSTLTMDYPTTEPTEYANDSFEKSTTLEDKSDTYLRTIDTSEEITESRNSEGTSVTRDVTTSERKETTSTYEGTSIPWLYVSGYENNDNHETKISNNMNDTKTDTTLKIPTSTPASHASDDRNKSVSNSAEMQTKMTTQTVSDIPEGTTKEISKSIILNKDENYVTTEPNNLKTISANEISDRSIDTTTKMDTTIKQINLSEKESFLHNDVIPTEATSTTPTYEKSRFSTTETSSTFQASIIEPQTKRPRGRVRFTNFAGNSDDANEQNRRPIKQLVVRRRLAKDRQRNATTTESNSIKSEILLNDKNQKTRINKIKNVTVEDQNVRKQNKNKTKAGRRKEENDEIAKSVDARIQNELHDRQLDERNNSSKATRRRVVVYRGRPRSKNIGTTAKPVTTTTTMATTTVQSSNNSSDEIADDKKRRRRKWRKRIVLKRSRINVEEDDQSIAESGVFRRALIDGEYVEDSPDEFTGSYIVMPDIVEKSSEHEDIATEVNPFKSSGAFLRRPGTLVRNDALNRLRSKNPTTSVPTIVTAPKVVPFAKIETVDPTYEMKTEDQSVRAQELAVTLSDPPAIDSSSTTGRSGLRKQGTTRKISTTVAPRTETTRAPKTTPIVRRRQNGSRYNNNLRTVEVPVRPRRPAIIDYDYYVDDEVRLVLKPELKDKLFVTKKGAIRCLDQGNFAHPTSCKKFITCARMVNGQVIGTEYTCPDKLSFDPVGGICNWSAGLGCEEKSKSTN